RACEGDSVRSQESAGHEQAAAATGGAAGGVGHRVVEGSCRGRHHGGRAEARAVELHGRALQHEVSTPCHLSHLRKPRNPIPSRLPFTPGSVRPCRAWVTRWATAESSNTCSDATFTFRLRAALPVRAACPSRVGSWPARGSFELG